MKHTFLKTALRHKPRQNTVRYKLPDDKKDHRVRIIPFRREGDWAFPVHQHWAPVEGREGNQPLVCPNNQPKAYVEDENGVIPTFGLPCAFEDRLDELNTELQALEGDKSEAAKKRRSFLRSFAWNLQDRKSYIIFVIDRENEDAGILEFACPEELYSGILEAYTNAVMKAANVPDCEALMELPDEQIPDLFDLVKGFDVLLRKTPREGRGFVFHANLVKNESKALADMGVLKVHLSNLKDPIEMVKALIEEQSDSLEQAVKALETRVKAKAVATKPLRGSQVDDDESLFPSGDSPKNRLPDLKVDRSSEPTESEAVAFPVDPEEEGFFEVMPPAKPKPATKSGSSSGKAGSVAALLADMDKED